MINIDFLICNYNTENLLQTCVASILKLNSEHLNVFIYIYDNKSNDVSLDLLKKFEINKKITIIYGKNNLGYGKAINKLFEISKSEYIFILNPDTILDFNCDQLYSLCKKENFNITGFKILNPERTIQQHVTFEPGLFWLFASIIRKGYPFFINLFYNLYFNYLSLIKSKSNNFFISGCALLMKRNIFEVLGRFNEKYFLYFEDTELLRLAKLNNFIVLESDLIILHNSSFSVKNAHLKIKTQIYKSALIFYQTNFNYIYHIIARLIIFTTSFLCIINPVNIFYRKNSKYFFLLMRISISALNI